MGRNKINIKKINNKNYLKATFSKRRKGLFRKATDLCCLSGAQIAIITFSPGNKPFLFGNPSAKAVLDRFLGEQDSCTSNDHDEEGLGSTPEDSDHEHLEASQEGSNEIEDVMDEDRVNFWWDEPIDDELGIYELQKYKGLLEALKENVASKLDDMNRREFYTKDFLSMFCISWIGSTTCQEDLCHTFLASS